MVPWFASCGGGSDDPGAIDVPSTEASRDANYEKAVEGLMSTYHPPGILAGVRVAGAAPRTRAFGQADVAQATPLSLNSTFPLRSITKSFTVTAFLQLVKLGQLGLDDKVGRYIAGVPNGSLISLSDLAGNQSGLVDYSMQPGFIEVFVKDFLHVWTPQELVAFSFAVPPSFFPGEQYEYSNTNTVLLGLVIEAVIGMPLGDVLAAQIFRPLGLTGTGYPSSAALPPPAPKGYAVDVATGAVDYQPLISPTCLAGSGARASTLADLLAWGDALGRGTLFGAALQGVRKSRAGRRQRPGVRPLRPWHRTDRQLLGPYRQRRRVPGRDDVPGIAQCDGIGHGERFARWRPPRPQPGAGTVREIGCGGRSGLTRTAAWGRAVSRRLTARDGAMCRVGLLFP